jgi:Helicase conserved C-terminal domain
MALLGLFRDGALSAPGRAALLAASPSDPAYLQAVETLFPAPIQTFTVQADLTAFAPAELDPSVRATLSGCADVESRGSATVFRFSESSIRRALDSGTSRDELVEFLRAHSIPSVPQPLLYLVDDVSRRYGSVVVSTATSVLHVVDEALLAEIVRAKKTAKLKLRLVAPTVAISALPAEKLVVGLREAGYLPVRDDGAATAKVELRRPMTQMQPASWHARGAPQVAAIWTEALRDGPPTDLDGFSASVVAAVHRLRSARLL